LSPRAPEDVVDREGLRALLAGVRAGTLDVDQAVERMAEAPVAALGYAQVDVHRAVRTGVPEVVYGAGKTPTQIAGILRALLAHDQDALATRVDSGKAEAVIHALADHAERLSYDPRARLLRARVHERPPEGLVGVVSAGTSDGPVADEAAGVAEALGAGVLRIDDVGIAGVHRVLARVQDLRRCDAIIVVAGMDGALPGLVAGLVAVPVIACPTSVGYGASFGGIAALLTMLNACAPGVSVVNIDNGFGAAYQAALIARARTE
jgi:NCAIR mutase (PurE)-related protein